MRTGLALGLLASTLLTAAPAVQSTSARTSSTPVLIAVEPDPFTPVGVGHPIVLKFDRPVLDRAAAERAGDVTPISPGMTGSYVWLEPDVVQWVPDRYWPAHSTVLLSVGGTKTQLTTGPEVIGVADISDHTFIVTVDGQTVGLPSPHHLPRAGEEGVLLATMGRPEYGTPPGKYTVLAKERNVRMDSSSVGIPVDHPDGYLLDVDYAVRFTRRGLFVHSAPWAASAIGFENVSHGCVSLLPAAAEWYYNTVSVGDPVIVQE
ncbi:L,D-transpeptidase [Mycolicibacterium brumae]|nr:L,D-transpeptidase [Mycolicibacterium brumae]UWW10605.1 L,D-transpeptidase [Mycolicibacterium brumae]